MAKYDLYRPRYNGQTVDPSGIVDLSHDAGWAKYVKDKTSEPGFRERHRRASIFGQARNRKVPVTLPKVTGGRGSSAS